MTGQPFRSRLHCEQLETRYTPTTIANPSVIISGLVQPTAMAASPDGRIFVAEKAGTLRVVQNYVLPYTTLIQDYALLDTPFVSLSVDTAGERGLIGVALDPNFTTNGFVYAYYTTAGPTPVNRVSRFTANGNVGTNETVLLDNIASAPNHNGGALAFGADGKLYVGTGDAGDGNNAQTLNNLNGKVLRLNPDGTVPTDNPFYATATGDNRAIYALGLQNPLAVAVQPGTGRLFITDSGDLSDEVNEGAPGANYGWPGNEGDFDPGAFPNFTRPVFTSPHLVVVPGASAPAVTDIVTIGGWPTHALSGGTFYNPATPYFPAQYVGDYFFAKPATGDIFVRDGATGAESLFASAGFGTVDLDVAAGGWLFALNHSAGSITVFVGSTVPNTSVPPYLSVTPSIPTPQYPNPTGTGATQPVQTIAVGTGPGAPAQVAVLNTDGTVRFKIAAYDGYSGGVRVATGDVNGDGVEDVITGTGPGAPPHVKVFDGATGAVIRSFLAFDPAYRGGLYVAAGDIDGDGRADIIVGTATGSSHVKIFDAVTGAEVRSFLAFDGFTGGVTVAAGDWTGRGRADVIVGTATGSSHIKVFDGTTGETTSSFLAFVPEYRGGVSIGAGTAGLFVGSAAGATHVKLFSGGQERASFYAFDPEFAGGVRVAANGPVLVAGAGPGAGPQVKTFESLRSDSAVLDRLAFDPALPGGVFVG